MSGIIFRHLAATFIIPLIVSTIFFILFLLTFQILSLTEILFGRGLGIGEALLLLFDIAITFVPLALPISILFATIFSFSKLSNDSEYVALRSFGYGKFKIFLPYLFCAAFMAFNLYFLNQQAIPLSKKNFKTIVRQLKSSGIINNLRTGQFFAAIPGLTLFPEKVEEGGEKLENLFIHVQDKEKSKDRYITAKRAHFYTPENSEILRLSLQAGNMITENPDGSREKVFFEKYDYPIPEGAVGGRGMHKANMMTGSELVKIMRLKDKEWEKFGLDFEEYRKTFFEYWNRINTPFLCLIYCLLGYGLGAQANRRQKNNTVSSSLFILIAYYGLFFLAVSQSNKGNLNSAVAVFLPTFLLLFVAMKFYQKLDWSG
jgi:lipopolysaccharide export system permease protein